MKGQLNIKRSPLKVQNDKSFSGSNVNPSRPNVVEASPARKAVKIAPGINEGTSGKPDGAKRIIQNEAKPAGRNAAIGKSTFRAPRNDSVGGPTESGYTKISMGAGSKGNGRGNGNR
jgi:hypothetical protein